MQPHLLLQRRIPPIALGAMAIVALTLMGHWLQSGTHLNHDVSYFVHFDTWLLQGRSLGDDLFDGNLPMVWALFLPASALAHLGVLDEPTAVRLLFWAYFLGSATMLVHVALRAGDADRAAFVGWISGFVLVATLAPGFSFGQREHASVLFAMPYLAVATLRLRGERLPCDSVLVSIGVLAGIGFSIKPHFVAVPALVELWLMINLGLRRQFLRTEFIALFLTLATYVAVAAIFLYDYLSARITLTFATYWAYETATLNALFSRWAPVAKPVLYGIVIAMITRTWRPHHTVILLAGLGYTVCYFVQGKGFVYHAYPVLVCAITFLGICAGDGILSAWNRWQASRSITQITVLLITGLLALAPLKSVHDGVVRWYVGHNIAWGAVGQFRQAVIEMVEHFAPGEDAYYYAFSTHPFPGFPTASYVQAEWSGRSINQPFVPAIARMDEVADPTTREKIVRASELLKRMVVDDFERRPPRIVFVENGPSRLGMNGRRFDDLAFYLTHQRFRKIWEGYEELPPLGPLRVFVLRGRPADSTNQPPSVK